LERKVKVHKFEAPAMKEIPRVSVIILAYNYARFLPAAVESALSQTLGNCEVIVVDNGSTDETPEVAERYSGRIVYLRLKNNLGRGGGKNAGLSAAKGKYIQFLDADDTIRPEKLEKQVAILEARPEVDVVYCDSLFVNEKGEAMEDATRWYRSRHFTGDEGVLERLLQECFLLTHDGLMRRDAIDDIDGFDDSRDFLEDWDFWLRLAVAGKRFEHLPETLADYNWHGSSLTKNTARSYSLRRELVYKFVDDVNFKKKIGVTKYSEFLRYQHRELASGLYTLGRWRESRAEIMKSFKNGGSFDRASMMLYLKSIIRSYLQ
jgi:glycosyltransferase involved in cell wall biosynthesis